MNRQTASVAALVAALLCPAMQAATQRTFVSTSGVDTNPCTRPMPCRNFPAAIAQSAPGGEVYVLDSGGYGMAVISSAITIRAEGVSAGISVLPTGTAVGVLVNTGPSDVVTLHGLTINGVGGNAGISFGGGAALHVENVAISNCYGPGIQVTAASRILVTESTVRGCAGQPGLSIQPASGGAATASVDRCRFEHNGAGVVVYDGGHAAVRDSSAGGSQTAGFLVSTTFAAAELTLDRCVSAGNGAGVQAYAPSPGSSSIVRISNTSVTANTSGLTSSGNSRIISFGNNHVAGNITDGAPNQTIAPM